MCIDIAYCHHERYNGTGYPRRIAGEEIPLSARIIALADMYDAITSERRYEKAARSHQKAVEMIRSEAGQNFDPALSDGLGLQIVRTLVTSELGGSLLTRTPEDPPGPGRPGTEVVLDIPGAARPRR